MPFTKTALTPPAARCLHSGTVNMDGVNDGDGGREDSDGDCGNGDEACRMEQSMRLFIKDLA